MGPINMNAASEPKIFRLTAVDDWIGSSKLCSLHIEEDGRVEGKLMADTDWI